MPIATKQIPPLTDKIQAHFWSKVNKDGPTMPHMQTPCYVWMASKSNRGYGKFCIHGNSFRSHRVAYFLEYGDLQEGLIALHLCDNPSCCNPAHLKAGTCAENNADAIAKGRTVKGDNHHSRTRPDRLARGEQVNTAKLTAEKVREIRQRYSDGGISQRSLAIEFCVTKAAIRFIICRRNWAHVI